MSSLPNVLAAQAGSPALLRSHLAFYRQVMFAAGGLPRRERELVATAVSVLNRCFY
jgi:alkylhydroperoxidase/carboxymuconolactone decarboxylase family protein YurZ